MKILLTAMMVLLTGCITSEEEMPIKEYQEFYYQKTTVCIIMFPDRAHIRRGTECAAGENKVAVGFRVEPIHGECEPAFFSLHKFQQVWGCE